MEIPVRNLVGAVVIAGMLIGCGGENKNTSTATPRSGASAPLPPATVTPEYAGANTLPEAGTAVDLSDLQLVPELNSANPEFVRAFQAAVATRPVWVENVPYLAASGMETSVLAEDTFTIISRYPELSTDFVIPQMIVSSRSIELNSYIEQLGASDYAKILILAKEGAHISEQENMQRLVLSVAGQFYDIPEGAEESAYLYFRYNNAFRAIEDAGGFIVELPQVLEWLDNEYLPEADAYFFAGTQKSIFEIKEELLTLEYVARNEDGSYSWTSADPWTDRELISFLLDRYIVGTYISANPLRDMPEEK